MRRLISSVTYGDYAEVEKIEPRTLGGTDVWFDCFKVPISFHGCPAWGVGDRVRITFQKVDDAKPN